jgi:hypothetical protein
MSNETKRRAASYGPLVLLLTLASLFALRGVAEADAPTKVYEAVASESADTDILSADLRPSTEQDGISAAYHVTVAVVDTSIFYVVKTPASGVQTERVWALNSATVLEGGAYYTFSFGVTRGYTYNFRVKSATTVDLLVEEILDGSR